MTTVNATDATFEQDVLDRSTQATVVVDLWAAWCGPCRTLGPMLERVVAETDGRAVLVKVDVDSNPQVSAAFGVQSIPAVYALRDRKVVDSFIGSVPEAQVREFVTRVAPAESDVDRITAAGDEQSLRRALELQPDHVPAVLALASLLIDQAAANGAESGGAETGEALALLARIPENAESRRLAALARVGEASEEQDSVEGRLDDLLDRVRDDEAARQEFVDLLEVLGPDDPRTPRYRRALTSRLF